MREVVICEPVRTPIGRYGGMFASLTAVDLAVVALKGLLERTGVAPDAVEDVILGHCYPSMEAPAIGRVVARAVSCYCGPWIYLRLSGTLDRHARPRCGRGRSIAAQASHCPSGEGAGRVSLPLLASVGLCGALPSSSECQMLVSVDSGSLRSAWRATKNTLFESGAQAYITKPFTPKVLFEALANLGLAENPLADADLENEIPCKAF